MSVEDAGSGFRTSMYRVFAVTVLPVPDARFTIARRVGKKWL